MGYTHYYRRPKSIGEELFSKILADFKKALPKLQELGVVLADGHGQGKPTLDADLISFNGPEKCGHARKNLGITWPAPKAGGIIDPDKNPKVAEWFAGAVLDQRACGGDCSHETMYLPKNYERQSWQKEEDGLSFQFCKTAYKPYDLAVISLLIIAKHHLGKEIEVSSDGEMTQWFDGMYLCQSELGYGLDFKLDGD